MEEQALYTLNNFRERLEQYTSRLSRKEIDLLGYGSRLEMEEDTVKTFGRLENIIKSGKLNSSEYRKIIENLSEMNETFAKNIFSISNFLTSMKKLENIIIRKTGYLESDLKSMISNTERLNITLDRNKRESDKLISDLESKKSKMVEYDTKIKMISENARGNSRELEKVVTVLQKEIENVNGKAEKLNGKLSEYDEKLKELDDILGKAVADNMSGTFKSRAEAIRGGKIIFLCLIVFMIFAIVGNVSLLIWKMQKYYSLKEYAMVFPYFISLMTLSLFTIYFITQYNHERKLEEEYEFKRAISISLNHFAGQFDQNEEKKQELIFDSVKSLYKAPNKNLDLASLNKKEMIKLVKCISKIIEKQGFNIPLFSKD